MTNIHSHGCITTGTSTEQNDCERLRLLNSSLLTEWLKSTNPENEWETKIKGFPEHEYAKKENEAGGRNMILLPGVSGKKRVGLGFRHFQNACYSLFICIWVDTDATYMIYIHISRGQVVLFLSFSFLVFLTILSFSQSASKFQS